MAEKLEVSHFTKTLIDVNKKLQSIDIQRLVFICRDLIAHHDLDKINTGMELFQALEQEKHIQRDVDISLLLEILHAARRVDLSDEVAAEMNVPEFTVYTKKAISRYRYLMLEIAMTLSDQEIEEVTFMAAELLGCAKDNIQDIYQLLVLLEKDGHISEGDVRCLHQDLITHQLLNKKIKEYEEAMTTFLKEEEKGKKSYVEGCMQDNSSFNLESVRRQLKDEYLETRGKLPLLPGMPEEFARMEDLFVDLHIVEEEKKPDSVISKELKSHKDLVCITQEVEKDGKKEKRDVKRILVRGKPGIGKSSTVSKLAYDWACGNQDSPVSKFQLLFAITIHEIDASTDLIGVIQDQLLPKVSRKNLEDNLKSNASSVVILLDGYDEASKHFHQSRNIKNVLCSKWLSEACVIVTTRPNQVSKFTQNYGPCLQVEILGFSDDERKKLYVEKFMKSKISQEEFLYYLYQSSLEKLAFIPVILSMLCLLWVENQKLPSTVTALYKAVITHLAKHSYSKTATDDPDMEYAQIWIDSVLNQMGEVALEGLFKDRLVFSSNKFQPKGLKEACTLGVVTKEKKRSGLNVTCNVTFLHKTFQEFCAAKFWVALIHNDEEKFNSYLKRVNNDNVIQMEYLLRFACGLNLKAAEIILPHVLHILCQHKGMRRNVVGHVKNISDNPCQQLGIILLHEAESNNAQIGQCIELHKHLKPLIKAVHIVSPSWEAGEFQEILSSYIRSQQSVINDSNTNSDGHLWLDDVKDVYVEISDDDDSFRCISELVCAMPKISILHIGGKCDSDQFLLPCTSSLTKLDLDGVTVHGELPSAVHLPEVKELCIESGIRDKSKEVCKAILKGYSPIDYFFHVWYIWYSQEGMNEQDKRHCHKNRESPITCIPLETMRIQEISLEPDDVNNLVKAMKFMLHLRILNLQYCCFNSRDCFKLFDALIEASNSRNMQTCSHENKSSSGVGHDRDLVLQELDLSENVIGDSIRGFVKAYGRMPNLKCLKLSSVVMKARHCEELFKGFIEAGQTRNDRLALEVLNLSQNEIGDSVGKLGQAYRYMTHLRCLNLSNTCMNPSQCAQLFDGFLSAGELIHESEPHGLRSGVVKEHDIVLEELNMALNEIGDSIGKLAQAYRYMTHLRCLDLSSASMNPSQCAQLFDGFFSVGELMQSQQKSEPHGLQSGVLKKHGLAVVELNMSHNDIGDSVEKLAQGYRHMRQLRSLVLSATKLNPSHCAVLFDGFITAGKMVSQDESSSNTQGDASSTPQRGLGVEKLDLSDNEIGESVDKLLEALTYMPHLKALNLSNCKLSVESKIRIDCALKTISNRFTMYPKCGWEIEDWYVE